MSQPAGYIVYDLEYTSWPGAWERGWTGPGEHREIVQIGAVRVDAAFRELASLCLLVRPRINPTLSSYFVDLTGISQDALDARGIDVVDALESLLRFAEPDLPLVANGGDALVIAENCRLAGIADRFLGRTHDVYPRLLAATGRTHLFSADLPKLFDLAPCGRGHDALADARAVAGALAKMRFPS
ncbi:conserved hypothetical protein [Magnetospirillum sp. LM-5]|uniref:3'-5' exonuclease n=1 Tax=Magnetospirillum sp. LM-5 TaxID=2681466 RepID=UPI0013844B52|nr:3'-5' exonuclease [Magnetospirillum sp. LM-5]CAA7622680.1 conserved hypothetical protein [Magnetospirillum sp. LM-5]